MMILEQNPQKKEKEKTVVNTTLKGSVQPKHMETLNSLVMSHANIQDGFSEGKLQNQFVFGIPGLTGVVPDQD